jgi:predicted HicB family RNase H-like nuclease
MEVAIPKKRPKTFPLEMRDELHKALKHRAIEQDKTLHAYIIDALTAAVDQGLANIAPVTKETFQ